MTDLQEPFLGKNPTIIPVSNSEMQVYKECKRKWWLSYYRGLRPKKKNVVGPLPLGTRVHNALEYYYGTGGDIVAEYLRLLDTDKISFYASPESALEDKVAEFNDEAELGRLMVEGYVQWLDESGADAEIEVVSMEQKISAPVLNGAVELQGKIDMRVKRAIDGSRAVMDHKTAATFAEYDRTAHMSEQLRLYTMLERMQPNDDTPVDGGIYNLLRKVKRSPRSKPPFYKRIDIRFNNTDLRSFWTRTQGTLRDMLKTRKELDDGADHHYVAYPTPTRDCSWKCPFYLACTMFDDGSAVEEMVETFYEKTDPYERYQGSDDE